MRLNTRLSVAGFLILLCAADAQNQPPRPSTPSFGTPASKTDSTSPGKTTSTHREAQLKWNPSSTPHIDGYYVYRAVGGLGAGFERITPAPIKQTEYTDESVEVGKTYVYAVTSVRTVGKRIYESGLTPSVVVHVAAK